ncbi:MAG: UDP-2,4-diacetamido-2,4,6-trideoxy-beta-L-altropyranose hydrolase [Planctomycetaceae bacterium]
MATLILRADGGGSLGTGHMMRLFALAQSWKDAGGQSILLTAASEPRLDARFQAEGIPIMRLAMEPGSREDARRTAEVARAAEASWVAMDGYLFDGCYQRTVEDEGARVLFLDDYGHCRHYSASLILNQNVHAREALYASREPSTRLLLGTRFVLLRREFLEFERRPREARATADRILLTLGGGDPGNATLELAYAALGCGVSGLSVRTIVGPANAHLRARLADLDTPPGLRFLTDVTEMAPHLDWAELAVAAGGTTAWEIAFMGLPALLVVLSDNQVEVARGLEEAGVALNLGRYAPQCARTVAEAVVGLLDDPGRRGAMSQRGRDLVDGGGGARVVTEMLGEELMLRRVRESDCRLLWEWANDAGTRSASFSRASIPWEEHLAWFRRKTSAPDCIFFVALDREAQPVGQVRYDLAGEEAVMSVSVARERRGEGLGPRLISLASRRLFRETEAARILALVKEENRASGGAFLKAGFGLAGRQRVGECESLRLLLERSSAS